MRVAAMVGSDLSGTLTGRQPPMTMQQTVPEEGPLVGQEGGKQQRGGNGAPEEGGGDAAHTAGGDAADGRSSGVPNAGDDDAQQHGGESHGCVAAGAAADDHHSAQGMVAIPKLSFSSLSNPKEADADGAL